MLSQRFSLVVAGVLAAGLFSHEAHANASGKTGFSGKQGSTCVQACHATGASTLVPTVTINGPATLTAGSTGNYTLIVTGGPAVKAGMNVAVSDSGGTLNVAGSDLKVESGELTHTAAKAFANGEVRFDFSLVAPSTSKTVTLYASGNSVNGNFASTGDNSASTTFNVQVTAASTPDAGAPDAGTPDAGTDNPGGGEGDDDGGCSAAGGAPMVALLALVAARMRRRNS
ncbi:MXAN_6652 family MXYO-CTERM-anchored protein [Hyalangium versicolor]|uniref:MXAN_6652 family MXYO-CTERM-anchored protein n=1 Tax=Hyalangium versicolor TaxID=2861190 RepID=UPI001CCF357E|nr:MXAN_6652 family MXYO-CTERM-anchored protein [Hyalangium versicolor]